MQTKKPGYIYLLQDDNYDWHYKIGMSIDPIKRTKQIGYASLVHFFPTDDMEKAEEQLHIIYQNQRTQGEWFKLFEPNLEYIQSIKEYRKGNFITLNGEDNGCYGL